MFTSSIFAQLLKLVPQRIFDVAVERHQSDRWRKSFRTWDHLVALLAVQFSGAASLRDVETVINSHSNHLYHLKCKQVRRSTLSEANQTRHHEVFRDIALSMLSQAKRDAGELKTLISILDASVISLSGRGHDWAIETRTRNKTQGLKLHVQYAPGADLVEFVKITGNNICDIAMGREIQIEEGRIYVFDRGYCDYNWWHDIAKAGSRFVTRLKTNAAFATTEERQVPHSDDSTVIRDRVIKLTNASPRAGKKNTLAGEPLRLVEITHPKDKDKPFWIVSNDLDATADQIAAWYKQRWAIELMFKWLKQNLKIKRFIGESHNAILIQIYVAIIAYMLLRAFHKLGVNSYLERLKDVLVYVRNNLFERPQTFKLQRLKHQERLRSQPELWSSWCENA